MGLNQELAKKRDKLLEYSNRFKAKEAVSSGGEGEFDGKRKLILIHHLDTRQFKRGGQDYPVRSQVLKQTPRGLTRRLPSLDKLLQGKLANQQGPFHFSFVPTGIVLLFSGFHPSMRTESPSPVPHANLHHPDACVADQVPSFHAN